MPNMSYCRFENTYRALVDCHHNMDDNLSQSETVYRKRLIELCAEIIDEWEDYDFDADDSYDEPSDMDDDTWDEPL